MNNPMTYIQNGDYQIPDLELSQQPEKPLGKYGRMRKTYLKEHRPILYNQMLMSEKLFLPLGYILQIGIINPPGLMHLTGQLV